jgi:hypothetical protein
MIVVFFKNATLGFILGERSVIQSLSIATTSFLLRRQQHG